MEKSLNSSQNLRSIKPKHKSDIGKRHIFSNEFINYKPLDKLDLPVESEDSEDDSKQYSQSDDGIIESHRPAACKLSVDHPHIDVLLRQCVAINLEHINIKALTPITISFRKKLQLFLDLDDTLIFTSRMRINIEDIELENGAYICVRPFTNLFLSKLCIIFDIIVNILIRYSRVQGDPMWQIY